MVAVGDTTKVDPVPIVLVVPHEFAYQLIVPEPPMAVSVVDCPEQIPIEVAVIELGPIGPQLMVAAHPE